MVLVQEAAGLSHPLSSPAAPTTWDGALGTVVTPPDFADELPTSEFDEVPTVKIATDTLEQRFDAYLASREEDRREPLLPPCEPRTTSSFNVATARTRSKTLKSIDVTCSCGPTTDCGAAK